MSVAADHLVPLLTFPHFLQDTASKIVAVQPDLRFRVRSLPCCAAGDGDAANRRRSEIRILEKMVLFHVYSAFRMVEMQYRCFDPVINRQHLSECLNILMTQYDSHQTGRADLTEESISRRAVFEAIFLMHNFLYDHAIVRFGSIPASVSANETAAQAFRMAAAFRTGNFFRVLAALPLLPVFSLMALAPHIPAIQLNYARILSSAFAPPAPPVSLKYLTRILCPFEKHAVAAEYVSCLCQQFDAKIDQSIVRFHKSNKDSAATANILRTIPQRAWSLLDKRLANDSIRDLINFTCPDDP